jgi:hypothetical protein
VIEFWTRAEEFRKRPWRLVSVFGPRALLLFLFRRLTLSGALEHASRVIGSRVRPVEMPFAEAAVDVDKLADYELVKRVLAERGEGASPTDLSDPTDLRDSRTAPEQE